MTGARAIGNGFTVDGWYDQHFIVRSVDDAVVTVRSREDFSATSSLRRIGEGTSDTAMARVDAAEIGRDIIASLKPEEFERVMGRVRRMRGEP